MSETSASQKRWSRRGRARRMVWNFSVFALELAIVAAAIGYVISNEDEQFLTILPWVALTALYLGIGFFVVRRAALRAAPFDDGVGEALPDGVPVMSLTERILDTVSGVFPFVTSIAGLNSALNMLFVRADTSLDAVTRAVLIVAVAVSIVLSWMMLQIGYARVYRSSDRRHRAEHGLRFPGTANPVFSDYLYFAFTVGASFATSDVEVLSRRMRWRVMIHNVFSYFYNAAIVALAISAVTSIGQR